MKKLKMFFLFLFVAFVTTGSFAQDPNNSDVLKPSKYPDGIYTKENSRTRKAIPYTTLREADVMWSDRIWRMIDLKEKINHPLYYPTELTGDRKSLFQVIKDAALIDGTITCFAPIDDEFRNEYTKTEIEGLLARWDSTKKAEDPNNPGVYVNAPQKINVKSSDITKYQIKEDWFFDRQRSVLDVRIIGIEVIVAKTTEGSGDVVGDKPLFWIYFPEARPLFANQEVYMRHNDAERRTLDDIFWKRLFSSYVVQESNVYKRVISEYTVGLDALIESDKIKNEIFEFEHDMWHF